MGSVDHAVFARPGYLIDARVESIAPHGALFSGLLSHHAEVGLSADQVLALLDLSRAYHEEQLGLHLEFAKISERLEVKWGRVDAAAIARRRILLDEHARIFRAEEELFFTYAAEGHAMLTDEQLEMAEAIYHAEKNAGLAELAPSLDNAVAPAFSFRPTVGGPANDERTPSTRT